MNRFTILGERCAGTNFLENIIKENFDLEITWDYGYKHFFGHSDYSNSDTTIFIGIVRDPIQWLCSFYKNPYHLPKNNTKNWNSFLTKEISSYWDKNIPGNVEELMSDRNILTGKRYKNIFELRKIKCNFLLETMPEKVNNYILIKYEDLINEYSKTLEVIARNFNLTPKYVNFKNVNTYKKSQNKYVPKIHELPVRLKDFVLKSLDKEVENKLGYLTDL